MMAAEKWYEYQTSYSRYGLDMRPPVPAAEKKPRVKARPGVPGAVKVGMIALTVMIGIFFIGLIVTTAYSATLQYDINSVNAEALELQSEIDNLKVKIRSEANIQVLEEKAVGELGMTYPTSDKMIYLDSGPEAKNFALALKENAYTE